MRTAAVLLAYLLALAFGLYLTFEPTIDSRFARVQTERGDGMLNHFILEHSWQSLSNPSYRGSLFSPPCFFPEPSTLWYSEHMLGVAPLYWGLRLVGSHVLAYQLWQIILAGLNFVAFAYVARRLGCPHILALLGAYLWAFGLVHLEQVKHQQMIPRFWMPLAAYYAWSFAISPAVRSLNRMLACAFLQSISCMYTGWFLVVGLGVFLPLAVVLRPGGWAQTVRFVKENRRGVAIVVGGWIAIHLAAFLPYIIVNADMSRSYVESYKLVPTPAAWLTGPPGTPWDNVLGPRAADPAQPAPGLRPWVSDECWLFCGFGIYALVLAATLDLLVRRPPGFAPVAAGLLTAFIWVLLTLTLEQEGRSLWELVRFVPGATAIRCVSRVYVIVYLFGTLAALVWLTRVTEALAAPMRCVILGLIAAALIAEQLGYQPPSFERVDFYDLVDRVAERGRGADALYVQPAFTDTKGVTSTWVYGEVFAMWVGLRANAPVVNGYSGRGPPGEYPWQSSVSDPALVKWLSGRFHGTLTILDPDHPSSRRVLVVE